MKNIRISILIVVRNNVNKIISCIKSIENQFENTDDSWELIIVDGVSNDGTKECAENYLNNKSYPWRIINNPLKILASGWNIGLKNALGKFVLRPDVHSRLHPNYVKNGINFLEQNEKMTAVGGALQTNAEGFWGEIIACALSLKIGVGSSPFRTKQKDGIVDTVAYGIYRRSIFDQVGFFNENLIRHQDNDMHDRLKKQGGLLYLLNSMKADYYCRDSIKTLSIQMYQNGFFLTKLPLHKLRIRHLMPISFHLTLLLMLCLTLMHPIFFIFIKIILFCYFFTIACCSVSQVFKRFELKYLFLLIIVPIMHFQYAWGMFKGYLKFLKE